jgi:RNA polymerase sigma-70 factor (ECF subfamily)
MSDALAPILWKLAPRGAAVPADLQGCPELRDGGDAPDLPDLEDRLQHLVQEARSSWPTLAVAAADFVAYVAERLPDNLPLADALASVHASDLYLACGCTRADAAALSAFDQQFLARLDRVLQRLTRDAAVVDEVRQAVRTKLLVAAAGQPRIADYSGRGSLHGWVRSVAARVALDLLGSQRRATDEPDGVDLLLASDDPELEYMRARYRDAFRAAFAVAFAGLPLQQRNALRLHYLDGMNLAQIGRLNRVHESTVSRWLQSARDELFAGIRAALTERLKLDDGELESLMRVAGSRLEISLHALLAKTHS